MRNAAFYMGGDFVPNLKNNNKTYQFITAMQEIKLQDCEQRRRWEWEDVQAELFEANMKNLKLQQTQEAGSIFINDKEQEAERRPSSNCCWATTRHWAEKSPSATQISTSST